MRDYEAGATMKMMGTLYRLDLIDRDDEVFFIASDPKYLKIRVAIGCWFKIGKVELIGGIEVS